MILSHLTKSNQSTARVACWLAAGALALVCASTASSQGSDKAKAGLEVWKSSGCSDCHGAFANGEKDRDEAPTGANLAHRASRRGSSQKSYQLRQARGGDARFRRESGHVQRRGRPLPDATQPDLRRNRCGGRVLAGTYRRSRANHQERSVWPTTTVRKTCAANFSRRSRCISRRSCDRRVLGVAALVTSAVASAQDSTRVTVGLATWKSAGCADCHGKFADGNPDDDDFPTGADLRTTRLDTAALRQTITCGRPGTGMPSFDEGAYVVRELLWPASGDADQATCSRLREC